MNGCDGAVLGMFVLLAVGIAIGFGCSTFIFSGQTRRAQLQVTDALRLATHWETLAGQFEESAKSFKTSWETMKEVAAGWEQLARHPETRFDHD